MGKAPPETRAQRGGIRVRSRMVAPKIFPAVREKLPLCIAVREVASSGREVPNASTVAPTMKRGIPETSAINSAASTKRSPPLIIRKSPETMQKKVQKVSIKNPPIYNVYEGKYIYIYFAKMLCSFLFLEAYSTEAVAALER